MKTSQKFSPRIFQNECSSGKNGEIQCGNLRKILPDIPRSPVIPPFGRISAVWRLGKETAAFAVCFGRKAKKRTVYFRKKNIFSPLQVRS